MNDLTGDPTIASTLSGAGGLVAGRYRVRARLGRGATKEVYLAYDVRLDREVALAIVVGANNEVARARVVREAQVTGRLGDHPNVITVYDTGEIDGVPYLVLRAMGGGSLAAALARERPSVAQALRIGREIAAALAHAHAHDVVHRDVKPDNVWLAADGTAALGDFGIAHVAGADRLTRDGVVLGTVRYLAPEQIRGDAASPASDLYSLGVTLYELATGRPPFTADDPSLVLTQHLTAAPAPPSQLEPAIPTALDELVLALLAKPPERRPASAAAVGEALAAIAATGATSAAIGSAAGPGGASTRAPAPSSGSAGGESRRLVAVLAVRADLVDPEALHGVFDRCGAVVEHHGGTVERYLGDALVGFFGLAASSGEDALRAARAAVELREAIPDLRIGLESGEVFVGAGGRGAAITGAPISAAGRLAERAAPGEILLGEDLRAAVAALAEADVDPVSGALLELRADEPALLRVPATPFVGRARELADLHAALAEVRADRACRLVTVSGPPGIGKSRLTREFLTSVGDEATVLAGRCLAYGEGTTYRALADIVRAIGDEPQRTVERLLGDEPAAARAILGAIGLADEPTQPDETAWALRRLLERLARDRPLVVAVEDIHWAEPVLLDALDHVVALSSDGPILLLCLTRPELLETRPAWAAPQPNRSLLVLGALPDAESRDLAEQLGARHLATRIARRAEGNPLFVEQLVAVDTGQDAGELPASVQAVLAARIDRLAPLERTLLQRAAVEGRTFHAGALAVLLPEEERHGVGARLVALARKGLVGADRPLFAGQDAFRFSHALIREAAYAGVPKLLRADLHARLAEWLEQRPAAADAIVGYHLEQACVLASALGRFGERERALADRAAQRLDAAARSALARGDAAGASALLERAIALLHDDEPARLALMPALGAALFEAGRMSDAARVLDEAARAPDPRIRARATVERQFVLLETQTGVGTAQVRRAADDALVVLERERDQHGCGRVWSLRGQAAFAVGRIAEAEAAWHAAGECARQAGEERELFETMGWRATASVLGPTPVDDAIRRCEEFRDVVAASPVALVWMINPLGPLYAMKGEMALAERFLDEANETLHRLGTLGASVSHHEASARLNAGQYALAEVPLRAGIETLTQMGDGRLLATTTAMLAQAVYAQGRVEEALELCRSTAAAAAPDDIVTQVIWRSVEGKARVRQGDLAGGEALARAAVALVAPTDLLCHHADAMLDLAEVLGSRTPGADADQAARSALSLYEQKGNLVGARRAGRLLGQRSQET